MRLTPNATIVSDFCCQLKARSDWDLINIMVNILQERRKKLARSSKQSSQAAAKKKRIWRQCKRKALYAKYLAFKRERILWRKAGCSGFVHGKGRADDGALHCGIWARMLYSIFTTLIIILLACLVHQNDYLVWFKLNYLSQGRTIQHQCWRWSIHGVDS